MIILTNRNASHKEVPNTNAAIITDGYYLLFIWSPAQLRDSTGMSQIFSQEFFTGNFKNQHLRITNIQSTKIKI